MKKVCNLIVIFILVLICSGCKKNNNLDLDELYEKNFELASDYFFGWGAEEFKYELIIFEPKNANRFEMNLFSDYFLDGVEKLIYIKYEKKDIDPYIFAIQYDSIELAKDYILKNPVYIRNENIVLLKMTGPYLLVYGDYEQVDGYWLSLDGEALLFDSQGARRINIVIPEGVKYVPTLSLISVKAKTITCNSDLEILYGGCFRFFSELEKIELNDGLKEIWGGCFEFTKLDYIVIPYSVERIHSEAFQNITIYCEINEKPKGWEDDFASNDCTIYWGGTWEYVDGVPQPIISEVE